MSSLHDRLREASPRNTELVNDLGANATASELERRDEQLRDLRLDLEWAMTDLNNLDVKRKQLLAAREQRQRDLCGLKQFMKRFMRPDEHQQRVDKMAEEQYIYTIRARHRVAAKIELLEQKLKEAESKTKPLASLDALYTSLFDSEDLPSHPVERAARYEEIVAAAEYEKVVPVRDAMCRALQCLSEAKRKIRSASERIGTAPTGSNVDSTIDPRNEGAEKKFKLPGDTELSKTEIDVKLVYMLISQAREHSPTITDPPELSLADGLLKDLIRDREKLSATALCTHVVRAQEQVELLEIYIEQEHELAKDQVTDLVSLSDTRYATLLEARARLQATRRKLFDEARHSA